MVIRIKYLLLSVMLVIILSSLNSYSQVSQQKPSRQTAIEAYSNGDYEKASGEFYNLLKIYPKDPLYKYYMGVCLVKMKRHPTNATEYLQGALNGSLDIKSIPDDATFYLGRAQQMAGKFDEAIRSFNTFENNAGRKKARDYNIAEYIQECNQGAGRVDDSEFQPQILLSRSSLTDKTAEQKVLSDNETVQSVEKPGPRKEKVPDEYNKVLSEAMDYQVKADSLNSLAAEYKKELPSKPSTQQQAVKSEISAMESRATEYQQKADERFKVSGKGTQAMQEEVRKPTVSQDNVTEIFSLFRVETNPELIKSHRVTMDPVLPEGLFYRIQMGVFSKPPDPSFFKGITPVTGFKIASSGAVRYFAGMFRRITDANRSLLSMKQMGFRDSFITAVFEGKPVSIERAALLEKEWGSKPLIKTSSSQKSDQSSFSTLVYRVEIARSETPEPETISDTYRKLAGNRGFEIIMTGDGTFIYLIGKFITFESASEYSDLLNRNGYREAKVVAYLGSKEISVETAKKLFETQK
jgi:tetratricopeptide (TPR) repeat protein